jgi:NAD(P)-dependent dehydrogenase (short-subunit alcohol dehydrogenase family)
VALYGLFKRPGPSGFGWRSTAEEVTAGLSLDGRTVLVTGVTAGLGRETLRVLSLRGAKVLATARTLEKARAACDAAGAGRAVPLACELSDPRSVRACAEEVRRRGARLDAIVCNAGIMALPRPERVHGIELQLFTNHVGHFVLVTSLLEALADDGRVVVVASEAHRRAPPAGILLDDLGAERSYSPWGHYGQSKLANILFARELARRLSGTRRTASALHPGVIHTELSRHMPGISGLAFAIAAPLGLKTIAQGAATQTFLAVHPSAGGASGGYWLDCNPARTTAAGEDAALAARLWDVTEQIVARLPR